MKIGGSHNRALRVSTFEVDATPPIGTPLCDGLVKPVSSIDDRIGARGLVILGKEKPIVLCVVDWVGIGNGGNVAWREGLALAAGTTPEYVAVHTTHAHDTPGCDFDTESLLAAYGLSGAAFDPGFARETIALASAALHDSLRGAKKVTHVGFGQSSVEGVASNRRLLGRNGKVRWSRWSSTRDRPIWNISGNHRAAKMRAMPEGTIDPNVYVVSFWEESQPVAALSYYACHPQSHYGQGAVSADFPGLARGQRQAALGIPCLHFNGAGGNITAGKYNNDDRPKTREVLVQRLEVSRWTYTSVAKHQQGADHRGRRMLAD